MHFTEPVTFGFSGFSMRPDGPRLVSDGARFSFGQSTVQTMFFVVFLSDAHPSVADGPQQGLRRPVHGCFSKKLLLSRIIYCISDSRVRIVVDELMHLRNDQLGNLVSP
jgi:hypothetical protein